MEQLVHVAAVDSFGLRVSAQHVWQRLPARLGRQTG